MMEKFFNLIKKYNLKISDDRTFIINPKNNKRIIFYWDDTPKSILEIENFHPNVDGEKEILEVLEEQIKVNLV